MADTKITDEVAAHRVRAAEAAADLQTLYCSQVVSKPGTNSLGFEWHLPARWQHGTPLLHHRLIDRPDVELALLLDINEWNAHEKGQTYVPETLQHAQLIRITLKAGAIVSNVLLGALEQLRRELDALLQLLLSILPRPLGVLLGVPSDVLAAVRRVLLSCVPAMAIDEVVPLRYTGTGMPLPVLLERIGLILIDSRDAHLYNEYCDACYGRGCDACATCFRLTVFHDEKEKEVRPVTAADLKPVPWDQEPHEQRARCNPLIKPTMQVAAEDAKKKASTKTSKRKRRQVEIRSFPAEPVAESATQHVLCVLQPGECIDMWMRASRGTALRHARWAVTTNNVVCRPVANIRVDGIRGSQAVQALVNRCPQKVFEAAGDQAIVKRREDCTQCRECVKLALEDLHLSPSAVTVTSSTTESIFRVPPLPNMPADQSLLYGVYHLIQMCVDLSADLRPRP
jgi:DNA-directed RNA polymerase alpha subunit